MKVNLRDLFGLVILALCCVGAAAGQELERLKPAELDWRCDVGFAAQREAIETELASEGSSDALLFELAKVEHLLGVLGDNELAVHAYERLETLSERYPDDALVEVYYGSAQLLRAKRAWLITTKGQLAMEGGKRFRRAVDAAPDDAEVQAIIGLSLIALPEWMDKKTKGQKALATAAELLEREGSEKRWTASIRAMILERCAVEVLTDRDGEDREALLRRAIEIAPESDAGRRAAEQLGASR